GESYSWVDDDITATFLVTIMSIFNPQNSFNLKLSGLPQKAANKAAAETETEFAHQLFDTISCIPGRKKITYNGMHVREMYGIYVATVIRGSFNMNGQLLLNAQRDAIVNRWSKLGVEKSSAAVQVVVLEGRKYAGESSDREKMNDSNEGISTPEGRVYTFKISTDQWEQVPNDVFSDIDAINFMATLPPDSHTARFGAFLKPSS
ncbi:hypothetical protein HK102_003962, partial [Quaeritorhiza haematococci]